jgi:hypothetical protein
MNRTRNARPDRRGHIFLKSRLKTPRVRDLYRSIIARRENPDAMVEAQALKIAELVVLAEAARARAAEMLGQAAADNGSVAGIASMINAVTRAEGTARRAMADFDKPAPEKPWSPDDLDDLWDNKGKEEERQ